MTFLRLTPAHLVAGVAALVLLLAMALDWYSTDLGEDARRIEQLQGQPVPGEGGEVEREVKESASIEAETEERNAWEPDDALDAVALALLIGSIVFALGAATLRAAGRSYAGPLTPSLLAALFAAAAAVVVVVRIIDVGAVEAGGQVETGAPLGVIALGVLGVAAARAARTEHESPRAVLAQRG